MISQLQKKESVTIDEINENTSMVHLGIGSKDTTREIITTKVNQQTVIKDNDEILFCISVDGSKHSEIAFNIVTQEFLSGLSKLLVVHVFNEKLNHLYNYNNKKETVIENYAGKMQRYIKVSNFIVEDRNSKTVHALEQVNKQAVHFKANYLVSGYYGIKGPKGDNKELSKGVDYLLGYSKVPSIIIKETGLRSENKTKRYSWLVVFDKQYNNSIKCFSSFLPLINPEIDFVFGLTLIPSTQNNIDDIKNDFLKMVEDGGIMNYDYDCLTYSKAPSTIINDKINFGTINFDFLVFYNNREKHRVDPSNSDVVNIVTKANSSICFYNF